MHAASDAIAYEAKRLISTYVSTYADADAAVASHRENRDRARIPPALAINKRASAGKGGWVANRTRGEAKTETETET